MALKVDYKDDGFVGNRKYRQVNNTDGTLSFEDVTPYNPIGDSFGALDINATNEEVNRLGESVSNGKKTVAAAITAKGQATAADAEFATMAANIGKIETESVLSGNAAAGDVLAGKTFYSTNPKSKATGTMVNRGAVSQALAINGTYAIPAGYHNGAGKVTQSIPVQGGSTVTPGTANKTAVAANRYVNGNVIVAGNANLIAANIRSGKNIFGVNGTMVDYSYLLQGQVAF